PTRNYSFDEQVVEEEDEDTQETSKAEKAVYAALGQLIDDQRSASIAIAANERATNLYNNADFKKSLSDNGFSLANLDVSNADAASFKIYLEGKPIYSYLNSKIEDEIKVQSAIGEYEVLAREETEHNKEVVDFARDNKDEVLRIKALIDQRKGEVKNLFGELAARSDMLVVNLVFSDPIDSEETIDYNASNKDGAVLLSFKINRTDGSLILNEVTYSSIETFKGEFIASLEGLDASTYTEKMISERKAELEAIFQEEAFKEFLSANGLTLANEPHDAYNKIVYDVKSGETVVLSFVIELSSGNYKILKGNEEIDLYKALEEGSKKNS
ncbi:hypothetical protein ACFL2V_22265, partial [Pseudomonadota bacterium]